MSEKPREIEVGFLCEDCLTPLPDSPPLAEDFRVRVGRTKRLCPECARKDDLYSQIRTRFIYPPIPIRTCDWTAWVDGYEEDSRYCAFGATEEEAIANLKEQLEDL